MVGRYGGCYYCTGFVANLGRDRERRPDLSDDGRYLDTVSACLSPLGTS